MNNNPGNIKEVMSASWIQISDKEFKLMTSLVYDKIGINLTEEKRTLVMGRLQKILRKNKFKSFQEYYDFIMADSSGDALSELATHISTNHTFFYREYDHFEFFSRTFLPELEKKLIREQSTDIRLWSAGCSSGEEPYTLVMLMKEHFGPKYNKLQAGILATDISDKALNLAQKGIYPEARVKELPPRIRNKYMKKINKEEWAVNDEIKNEVTYRRFNLMNKRFVFRQQFHSIFCRNVMIYFDNPTREALIKRFESCLEDKGYFFIGHSETLSRDKHHLKFIMPALYQKY